MNRIDKLIKELCPNGVGYHELKQVAEIGTGSSNGNEAIENGKYPLFVRSQIVKRINTFEFNEEAIIIPGEGGIGEIFHYINGKYALHQRAYRIHVICSEILTKFLCYYMKASFKEFILQKAVNATVISIRKPMIETFPIPIPPLPIQQEIVSILDTFTALDAALQAELEARRKQYEHYRDQLLSFEGKEVEWKTLGGICKYIVSGGTPSTNRRDYYGGDIPWLRTQEVDWNNINDTGVKITELGLSSSTAKWIKPNCVIIAMYGATAAKVAVNKIPLTTNQACCNLEINEEMANYRFVFHWICKEYENLKSLGEGVQSNINSQKIKNYPIPIPPLSTQHRIVSILDKFDALVNTELPAEIAARRKQYAYYREKLLTFKPLKS